MATDGLDFEPLDVAERLKRFGNGVPCGVSDALRRTANHLNDLVHVVWADCSLVRGSGRRRRDRRRPALAAATVRQEAVPTAGCRINLLDVVCERLSHLVHHGATRAQALHYRHRARNGANSSASGSRFEWLRVRCTRCLSPSRRRRARRRRGSAMEASAATIRPADTRKQPRSPEKPADSRKRPASARIRSLLIRKRSQVRVLDRPSHSGRVGRREARCDHRLHDTLCRVPEAPCAPLLLRLGRWPYAPPAPTRTAVQRSSSWSDKKWPTRGGPRHRRLRGIGGETGAP